MENREKFILLVIAMVFALTLIFNSNITGEAISKKCTKSSDCGIEGFVGAPYCSENKAVQNYISYRCLVGKCRESTIQKIIKECPSEAICQNAACILNYCGNGRCDYRQEKISIGKYVLDSVTNKKVLLEKVGSTGSVVVNVEKVTGIIPAFELKEINGVKIMNIDTYYSTTKAKRTATLRVGENPTSCKKDCLEETLPSQQEFAEEF